MTRYKSEIIGHLDIVVIENEDESNDKKRTWKEILIHGDPDGLKSLGKLLLKLASLDQENIDGLPIGAREHVHLRPNFDLSKSSEDVIVGRLDAKGTMNFYDSYIIKD